MKYNTIKSTFDNNKEKLMQLEGVHAVGIGYSTEEGHTDELSIHVFVNSEGEVNNLQQSHKIPENIETAPVSLIITPRMSYDILYVDKNSQLPDEKKYRPLRGGIQIYLENHEKKGWVGTLGCIVRSKDKSDDNFYILSNLHVLNALDRAVYQPKNEKDGFTAVTTTARSFPNTDAALARINDKANVEINTIEEIGTVNEIHTLTVDDLNKNVIKRGRTTLLTEGTIRFIDVSANVEISKGITRLFDNCVIVNKFADQGDSGSCVVLKESKKLVGLHFAGNDAFSLFCKIDNIFSNLNIELPQKE